MSLIYQLLVLDPAETTRSENKQSLMFLLRGFSSLWQTPRVLEDSCTIIDGATRLQVASSDQPNKSSTDEKGRGFIITLTGTYESIEARREPLAAFLKSLSFELIYVLRDQVSEQIACELYPHLYRIENQLRGYLIRFMATSVGPRWWEVTASADMADKAKKRKRNEVVFGKHVENSAFLIDFGELGELVYLHSSGFLTRKDIVERITSLPETAEAIRDFKQELRSNYYKFFKESFADKNFKDKWTQFEGIRNKIAHNNLFTDHDLVQGKRLASEIAAIISAADAGVEHLIITTEEREAIQHQALDRSEPWREISEESFLTELAEQEARYAGKVRGFVGVSRFVNSHLASKGFALAGARNVLEALKDRSVVEIYHVPNPNDIEFPTAALRKVIPPTKSDTQGGIARDDV